MVAFVILLVLGTSIWVFIDAWGLKVPQNFRKEVSFLNNHAWFWLLGCLFLWIIVFPCYLFSRAGILKGRSGSNRFGCAPEKMNAMVAIMYKVPADSFEKKCSYCGWQNSAEFVYCYNCVREMGSGNSNSQAATLEQSTVGNSDGKKFCTQCGKENVGAAKFCAGCGNQLAG